MTRITRGVWMTLLIGAAMPMVSGCSGSVPDGRSDAGTAVAAEPAASRGEKTPSAGHDWPWFLGPHGTGVSDERLPDDVWPEAGPPVLWKKNVGTGYSAPSVRGNRLVVHHRIRNEEIVECVDASTGETLWKHAYPSNFRDPYGYNNGPRCTPLLTEDRCYTFGAEGKLLCLELATGRQLWRRDTQETWDVPQGFFGVGCSPILEGNLLIALVGGQPDSGVVAFNAETGETVWESVGRSTWDGAPTGWSSPAEYKWTGEEAVVSYSSPIVATIHGRRHLLCLMRQGLVSLDPQTGEVNFRHWFMSRAYESVNAARPVVVDDKILLSSSYRVGSTLLQVKPDGKSYNVVWSNATNLDAHWSTPIHHDGYVYGFAGRHEQEARLVCLELDTGKGAWTADGSEPVRDKVRFDQFTGRLVDVATGQPAKIFPFYGRGSKIQVGDRFIVLGERGTLALVKVDPTEYVELCRAGWPEIGYPSWAAPVLSRQRLYLRDEDDLICLDLSGRK